MSYKKPFKSKLVKMAGYRPRFLFAFFMDRGELGQYPAISTSLLVNNMCINSGQAHAQREFM